MEIMSMLTAIAATASLVGCRKTVTEKYQIKSKELLLITEKKGISIFNDYVLANIELLSLNRAKNYHPDKSYYVVDSKAVCDFDDNPYAVVALNFGYSIYSVGTGVFLETNFSADNSCLKGVLDNKNPIYYGFLSEFFASFDDKFINLGISDSEGFLEKDLINDLRDHAFDINNSLMEIKNTTNMDFVIENKEGFQYSTMYDDGQNCGSSPWTTIKPYVTSRNVKEVKNSWYFKKCKKGRFPTNKTGICGYIALSIVLGYNEFFLSSGYFSDDESEKYIKHCVSNRFGDDVPAIADSFPFDIWGEKIGSSWSSIIRTAADDFLKGKAVNYSNEEYWLSFGSATKSIDDGFPAIVFGTNFRKNDNNLTGPHAIIVYGYETTRYNNGDWDMNYICHYGYTGEGYSEVIIPPVNLFQQGSIYSIYNKGQHVCKGYFESTSDGLERCGCGKVTG